MTRLRTTLLLAALALPMFALNATAQGCMEYSDDGDLIMVSEKSTYLIKPIVQYGTFIGDQDRVNSRGTPLTNYLAVLQQDRANVNRFNRPDVTDISDYGGAAYFTDEGDNFFTTVERRALFQTMTLVDHCYADAGDSKVFMNRIVKGYTSYLAISVFNLPNGGLAIHLSEAG